MTSMLACKRLLSPLLAQVVLTFLFVSSTAAQTWKMIGVLPIVPRCAYFFDKDHGVVGGGQGIYTYVAGTWTQATYPEFAAPVTAFELLDPTHLYACCGSTCVWVSTDQGATWQTTSYKQTSVEDIYLGSDNLVRLISETNTKCIIGSMFCRMDALHCLITLDDRGSPLYSEDGGITWNSSTGMSGGGYGCFADSCRMIYYAAAEGGALYRSLDFGHTFQLCTSVTGVDVLAGDQGVAYVQSTLGVQRSLDGGLTWQVIGGPPQVSEDIRMATFGSKPTGLIAFGLGNKVWKCDSASAPPSVFPTTLGLPDTTIQTCEPLVFQVHIGSIGHGTLHLHIAGDGTHTVHTSDTLLHFNSATGADMNVTVDPSDSLGRLSFTATADAVTSCYSATWTRTFYINVVPPTIAATALPITINACDSVRIPVLLRSTYCDSVSFDDVTLDDHGLGRIRILSAPTHPFGRGDWDTIWVMYTPKGLVQSTSYQLNVKGTAYSVVTPIQTSIQLVVSSFAIGSAIASIATPIKAKVCTDLTTPLVLRSPQCENLQIDSITTSSVDCRVAYVPGLLIPPNTRDTLSLTIHSQRIGVQSIVISVHGRRIESGQPFDTLITLLVRTGVDPKKPLIVAPRSVSLSNCTSDRFPIVLSAFECLGLTYRSCSIKVGSVTFTTNFSFPRTFGAGEFDTLWVTIPPQALNAQYSATIHVIAGTGDNSFSLDTTFAVGVTLVSNPYYLAPHEPAIDLSEVSTCALRDTSIRFVNKGCVQISVLGNITSLQPGWSIVDPVFPLTLAPDSGFTAHVHYQPVGAGPVTQYISYRFTGADSSAHSSEAMLCDATAIQGLGVLALPEPVTQLGTRSLCATDTTFSIPILNTGCDSLRLSRLSLDASSPFSLSWSNDTVIPPSGSLSLIVTFHTATKTHFDDLLHIHSQNAHGAVPPIDTTIRITADVTSGLRIQSLSTSALDFGSTTLCEEHDSSFTLSNKGCDTITITRASIDNGGFLLSDTLHFPIVLPPGTSVLIPVFTLTDTTGGLTRNSATLTIASDADLGATSLQLSRAYVLPTRFGLIISNPDSSAVDQNVTVAIDRTGSISPAITSLEFGLRYNDDLLSYLGSDEPDVQSTGVQTIGDGIVERTFVYAPALDRSRIASLHFHSYLAKDATTRLLLQGTQFTSTVGVPPDCIASIDNTTGTNSRYALELTCGNALIEQRMAGLPIEIDRMVVEDGTLTLSVHGTAEDHNVGLEIADILGEVNMQETRVVHGPKANIQVSLGALVSGSYFLRVTDRSPGLGKREVLTRKFVWTK